MEMRSINIDLDKEIIEINGKPFKEKISVYLPGPCGFPYGKLFNLNETNLHEHSDILEVKVYQKKL